LTETGATIAAVSINIYMPLSNNEIMPSTGFKADNFDKEKEAADKLEEQNKIKEKNANAGREREILQQQKETD